MKILRKITAPFLTAVMILNSLPFAVWASEAKDFESDILNKTVVISQDFESENAKQPLNLDASPYGPVGDIVESPDGFGKAVKYDSSHKNPFTANPVTKDAKSAVMDFDIYVPEGENPKNDFLRVTYTGAYNSIARIKSDGIMDIVGKPDETYYLTPDTWHTLRFVVDYNGARGILFAAPKGEKPEKIGEISLSKGTGAGIGRYQQATFAQGKVYCDNYNFIVFSDLFEAVNNCETASEVAMVLSFYEDFDIFTPSGDIKKAESEEMVYEALTGKSFKSNEEVKTAYLNAVAKAFSGIKLNSSDTFFDGTTASVSFANTSDIESSFSICHLAYENKDGYDILREKLVSNITIPGYDGADFEYATSSGDFKNLQDLESPTVKTVISKNGAPLKCITYGEELSYAGSEESATLKISTDLSKETGVFAVSVSGAEPGETVMISALDGAYTNASVADSKGSLAFSFMHPDTISSQKAYESKVSVSSGKTAEESATYPTGKVRPVLENIMLSGESVMGGTLKAEPEGYFQLGGLEEDESKRIHKWYVADSEESTPVLIEEENSEKFEIDDDSYGEKFIIASITVAAKDGEYSKEYFSAPSAILLAPKAKNVRVSGAAVEGNILKASYEYYHVTNKEAGSVLKWITLDENGKEDEILMENSLEYVVSRNDIGKTLAFSVTPMTDTEPKKGVTVIAKVGEVVKMSPETEAPTATEVKILDSYDSNTLSVSYTYSQKANVSEAEPDTAWYVADSQDGKYSLIGYNSTLEYKEEYCGKFIKVALSPISENEIRGKEVTSEAFRVYSVAKISDAEISGRKANDQKLRAKYKFYGETPDSDKSEILWYLDSELIGKGLEITTPKDSGGKEIKLVIKTIAKEFPHLGETVEIKEILDNISYADSSKSIYHTQTTVAPSSKYASGNMDTYTDSNPNTDYGENTYLSIDASKSSPWLTGFEAEGIVTVDMRVYLKPVEGRNEKSGEMIRFRHADSVWGPFYITFNSGRIKGSDDVVLPENEWINLRFVADPDDSTITAYYGSDLNHLEKINLSEAASVYAPTSATPATYLQLSTPSGSGVSDIWNIGYLSVSGMPPMYETAKTAKTVSELKEMMNEYAKYSLFDYPENYDFIDDESLVLGKVLKKAGSFESTKDLEDYLSSVCDLHQNGASVVSCVLRSGGEDVSGEVIKGIGEISSQTLIKNTEATSKTLYVLTAAYEKNANGNKTLRALDIKEVSLPGNESIQANSPQISLNADMEYTVSVMVWDKSSKPEVMLSVKSFNEDAKEEYTNDEKTPSDGIEIISCTFEPVSGQVKICANAKGGDGQYVGVESRDPLGNAVYVDEVYTSGKNGAFKSEFTLASPAADGVYTVEFSLNKSGKSKVVQFEIADAIKTAPALRRLKISGDNYSGNILIADYEYFQLGSSPEASSKYEWFISSKSDSGFEKINGENKKSIDIKPEYTGKYLMVCVVPVSANEIKGEAYESAPLRILAAPAISNLKITGDAVEGKTVSVSYKFSEPLFGYPEHGTKYEWYLGSELLGTEQSFKIPASASGRYLKCVVTPGIESYPYFGKSVATDEIRISSSDSSKGSGGGGGGGGRGSAPSAVVLPESINPGAVSEIPGISQDSSFNVFEDTLNHWADASIGRLYQKGIINGVDSNHYNPDGNVTRAEFAALINRITNPLEYSDINFDDVGADAWYFEDIKKIVASGIMQGSGQGAFRPDDFITREEMALVARRVYTYKFSSVPEASAFEGFADFESISPWAYDAVMYCRNAGILIGDQNGNYNPQNNVTRAEAAVVIERLINLK